MKPTETTDSAPASNGIVVFIIRRDAKRAECGEELPKGRSIRIENDRPLCLACADLAHLEFLPSGNTALTRRATKHSPLRAVVVQWARARNRYERQGILVTAEAVRRAEEECLADAELRERRRLREAERREAREPAYLAAVTEALRAQFPSCPQEEAARIVAWTCEKYSGRVGRSSAAKELDPEALRLAVIAHVRHEHTSYDQRLMQTGDRALARQQVWPQIESVLQRWESASG